MFSTPHPPRHLPGPPESVTSSHFSTNIGNRSSDTSISEIIEAPLECSGLAPDQPSVPHMAPEPGVELLRSGVPHLSFRLGSIPLRAQLHKRPQPAETSSQTTLLNASQTASIIWAATMTVEFPTVAGLTAWTTV